MRREQLLRLHTAPRVDWFAVLTDLRKVGWTDKRIAAHLPLPRSTIIGWKQGAEPKHADGERLVALWLDVTGKLRELLPMTHCPLPLDR